MIGNNQWRQQRGFTLAEMIVTVGVFAIALSIASVVILSVNKLQQNTANLEKLQNEGRYLMEKMAKEVRGRALDYSQLSSDLDGVASTLVFKQDELGETLAISYLPDDQAIRLTSAQDGRTNSANLNSEEVLVTSAKFIVNPLLDPATESTPLEQPRVTILLTLKNRDGRAEFQKQLTLQTTISSNIYR